MTDELLSLRAILMSGSSADHQLFREAASASRLPVEVIATDSIEAACRAITDGADLLFVDAASAASRRLLSACGAAAKPPFTILLAMPGDPVGPPPTDAVAAKPGGLEAAKRLVERSARVCAPSRVLIVDDSSTMRSIVRKILAATRFPFEVTETAEGIAAIKLARKADFDIVFLDYNMPGFSGLETLAEFKRENRRMSVVVMTSMPDAALAERVRAQGALFLRKPFFPADIEAALTRHYGLTALNPKRT